MATKPPIGSVGRGYTKRYRFPYGHKTKVDIHWSMKASAYAIKFHDTAHWAIMESIITTIKNYPYQDRYYDPENKTWYLMEQYINQIKSMIEIAPNHFELDFQEKQANQTFQGKFVSIDTYFDIIQRISGSEIKTLDYPSAKKIYRRACMMNHPDRGGDSRIMSELNEAWSQIEQLHFKIKKEPEYVAS